MARKQTRWISFHDDTDEKGIVRNIVLDQFDLNALQDEVLYFDKVTGHLAQLTDGYLSQEEILKKFFVHYPDLFIKSLVPQAVIEIDGAVHWQNSKAVHRTNARNCHYETAGIRFVWLTYDEVMSCVKSRESLISVIGKLADGFKILPRMFKEGPQVRVINKNKTANKIYAKNRNILGRARQKTQAQSRSKC